MEEKVKNEKKLKAKKLKFLKEISVKSDISAGLCDYANGCNHQM